MFQLIYIVYIYYIRTHIEKMKAIKLNNNIVIHTEYYNQGLTFTKACKAQDLGYRISGPLK